MKITIDSDEGLLITHDGTQKKTYPLYSKEAFEMINRQWIKVGWNQKYIYTFSWMGRPIIQLPEDMVRTQEVIWNIQPDVIIETGIAHGGSLVFYASLCKAISKGKVIGVDIKIRPHNREAIEAHPLFDLITLIEGDSADKSILDKVQSLIHPDDIVMVILDSNHSKQHVLNELEAFSPLVTKGSYIVATDGIMHDLSDVPRGGSDWDWNNPVEAVHEFLKTHPGFVLETPQWPFNESELCQNITHWPEAWLKKISD